MNAIDTTQGKIIPSVLPQGVNIKTKQQTVFTALCCLVVSCLYR